MEHLPDVYQQFERAFPHVHSAHQDLAKACYEGGPLDERAARLVKLGIALGAQAEGAVRSHARRALSEGESREDVRHVGLLALTTIGFPHTIAGLSWIEEVSSTARRCPLPGGWGCLARGGTARVVPPRMPCTSSPRTDLRQRFGSRCRVSSSAPL
jgi:4-carboxymuconolactone decarboxylase